MDDPFTHDLNMLHMGLKALMALFLFAFGASAGSLINVLVYRLPRGMDVIWAGSQCPCCETKLTWRENIPVLGWLALAGRCRFCRSRISAEYPLVELLVGLLWMGMYLVYYALPTHAVFCGVDWAAIRPEWAAYDANEFLPRTSWSIFIVHLFVVASLVAMTLVDAKTFTIPLALPWAAMLVGIIFHTVGAAMVTQTYPYHLGSVAPGASWGIPTPNWLSTSTSSSAAWWWIGAALGGTLGLVIANALLHYNLIRRSFEDYPEWEKAALKEQGIDIDAPPTAADASAADTGVPVGEHVGPGVRLVLVFVVTWLLCLVGLGIAGWALGPSLGRPRWLGLALGFVGGPFIAAIACRFLAPPPPEAPLATDATAPAPSDPDMWIAYPHARREMLKELIFLTPAIALAWGGGILAQHLFAAQVAPLWLLVLCGTLMGALIGGGVIWAVRILGSLGFGKEAMGLGDVHMMAGVGACLGWIDAALALPVAALVGLVFVIVSLLANRPAGKAMPFGPYLAVGTLLVLFGKPLVEMGLTYLLNGGAALPGAGGMVVNLP